MNNKLNSAIVFLLLFCLISVPLKAAEAGFYPARVKDISDRAYEKAVIGLLDNAQESITISMFIFKPGEHPKHPINRLMKDLEEALERDVSVTIYLNCHSRVLRHSRESGNPEFKGVRSNCKRQGLLHTLW